MINVEELSIGNLIDNHGKIITVDIDTLKKVRAFPLRYKPVLLTREMLMETEFIEVHDGTFEIYHAAHSCSYITIRIMFNRFGFWFILEGYDPEKSGVNCGSFSYVHEFQNLYKNLCKKEFQFK